MQVCAHGCAFAAMGVVICDSSSQPVLRSRSGRKFCLACYSVGGLSFVVLPWIACAHFVLHRTRRRRWKAPARCSVMLAHTPRVPSLVGASWALQCVAGGLAVVLLDHGATAGTSRSAATRCGGAGRGGPTDARLTDGVVAVRSWSCASYGA